MVAIARPLARIKAKTHALPQAEARVWRLTLGFGLATLIGYGFFPALGYMFVFTTLLLLMPPMPAPKPGQVAQLMFVALIAVAWGAILGQILFRIPILGLSLLSLGLMGTLVLQTSKPELAPVAALFVLGQTFIPILSGPTPALGPIFFYVMASGTIFAILIAWSVQAIFPERFVPPPFPPFTGDIRWVALRGTLIMLPPILLALYDVAYLPLLIKGTFLASQAEVTAARDQARELIGSTLMGGLFAFALWMSLKLMPDLFVFALAMATVGLIVGRNMYGVTKTRQPFTYWQMVVVTMIIIVGPSVSDPAFGNDADALFYIRIFLFFAVSVYAVLMVAMLDEIRRLLRKRVNSDA